MVDELMDDEIDIDCEPPMFELLPAFKNARVDIDAWYRPIIETLLEAHEIDARKLKRAPVHFNGASDSPSGRADETVLSRGRAM